MEYDWIHYEWAANVEKPERNQHRDFCEYQDAAKIIMNQRAEIARLQAEVERLKEDGECDAKLKDDLYAQTITAHNDAIEAAANEFKWNECDFHPSDRKRIRKIILALKR